MEVMKNEYGDHEGGLFPFHHGIYGYEEVITICLTSTKYVKLYQELYFQKYQCSSLNLRSVLIFKSSSETEILYELQVPWIGLSYNKNPIFEIFWKKYESFEKAKNAIVTKIGINLEKQDFDIRSKLNIIQSAKDRSSRPDGITISFG